MRTPPANRRVLPVDPQPGLAEPAGQERRAPEALVAIVSAIVVSRAGLRIAAHLAELPVAGDALEQVPPAAAEQAA